MPMAGSPISPSPTLPDCSSPGTRWCSTTTRVIPAQLEGFRSRDGNQSRISATLHMRSGPDRWKAFVRPGKRVKEGDRFELRRRRRNLPCGRARRHGRGARRGRRDRADLRSVRPGARRGDHGRGPHPAAALYCVETRRGRAGPARLPDDLRPRRRRRRRPPRPGCISRRISSRRSTRAASSRHFVTLHVGAGTFLPVKADDTTDHLMHSEIGHVSAETASALNAVHARGGPHRLGRHHLVETA